MSKHSMTLTSQIAPEELLKHVPDFTSWEEAACWLEESISFTPHSLEHAKIAALDGNDIQMPPDSHFGLYSDPRWRKFVLATYLADLVSYPKPTDQVSFDRLLFVMHAFSIGFRTWWVAFDDDIWRPIGYTGWYPMLETAYELFKNSPEKLQNRMVVPSNPSPYLYLFNFSVAPYMKVKALTRPLMQRFIQDLERQTPKGLACITVSEDGMRIANRLGMQPTGSIQGEKVYLKNSGSIL